MAKETVNTLIAQNKVVFSTRGKVWAAPLDEEKIRLFSHVIEISENGLPLRYHYTEHSSLARVKSIATQMLKIHFAREERKEGRAEIEAIRVTIRHIDEIRVPIAYTEICYRELTPYACHQVEEPLSPWIFPRPARK